MKRKVPAGVLIGTVLLTLSVTLFTVKITLFGGLESTRIYIHHALAMLPLNLLLMTFIFNKLLTFHTKRTRLRKQDMLVNAFFSELGNDLLRLIVTYDKNSIPLATAIENDNWDNNGSSVGKVFENHTPALTLSENDFQKILEQIGSKHTFILTLLEHPALVQHEKFSNLVWALFHLEDELRHRHDFNTLPESDLKHLIGDIERVYIYLKLQWVDYMIYLKENYPYLYSLAIRIGPFSSGTDAIVYE